MDRRQRSRWKAVLWWSCFAFLYDCKVHSSTTADSSESSILLAQKGSIDNWLDFKSANNLRGWDQSDPCTWTGIVCSPAGRVIAINLSCNACQRQAIGSLVPELGDLEFLESLDFSDQVLTGPLPEAWGKAGQMQKLLSLNLADNRLTGTLPSWSEVGSLPNLTRLMLSNNQLTGTLPESWGDVTVLPELLELNLDDNLLSGELPEVWGFDGAWDDFSELHLNNNNITGTIPESWMGSEGFSTLQVLQISNNQLEGLLPEQLSRGLRILNLSSNLFEGTLPSNWSEDGTSQLVKLSVADCQVMGGLPSEWGTPGAWPSLQTLELQGNNLERSLPASWGNKGAFPSLVTLNLDGNWLKGMLEASWGSNGAFPMLQDLYLGYNVFYKGLPGAWGQNGSFPSLRNLDLQANFLTGPLPESWGSSTGFPKLANLSLVWNRLSGTVPASWGALPSLATAWIQPGNYQVCKGLPANSKAALCKAAAFGGCGKPSFGSMCSVSPSSTAIFLPPTRVSTSMRVILRLQNSSSISTAIAPCLSNAFVYVMTSAASAQVIKFAAPVSGNSSYCVRSCGPAMAPALAPQSSRRLLAAAPGLLDAVLQMEAARGFDVQRMEEQLLTVLGSHAALTVFNSCGPRLDSITLLAAEPAEPDVLPGWWQNLTAFAPSYDPVDGWPVQPPSQAAGSESSNIAIAVGVTGGVLAILTLLGAAIAHYRRRSRLLRMEEVGELGGKPLGEWSFSPRQSNDVKAGHLPPLSVSSESSNEALTALQRRRENTGSARPSGPQRLAREESLTLPEMPWSDWEIPAADIQICRRPDGMPWKLGTGSFGTVYKALRAASQQVAVKILNQEEGGTGPDFHQEIALLKACRHSNIVAFQGVCIQEGSTLLVTEFMEGGDLFRALGHPVARQMLRWRSCGRNIALDIARGLVFLHARNVVHFDLKSNNILLSREGTAKISDVGLARIAEDGYISKLDNVAGTFAWAAPELLLGTRCSEKIDVYSFGVLLWELAVTSHTGERPQRGQLRDVRVPEELPEEVEVLRQDCLEVDPKLRPTAKQVYDRLAMARRQ